MADFRELTFAIAAEAFYQLAVDASGWPGSRLYAAGRWLDFAPEASYFEQAWTAAKLPPRLPLHMAMRRR